MATDSKKEKIHEEMNKEDNEKSPESFNDRLAGKARRLLVASQMYKQPRMNTIAVFERLYNNDIPPKLRQMFNVALPIFSGMVDEVLAMFNDDIHLKFKAKNPAQFLVVPKIQAHWDAERDSLTPNANWNYKGRTDRFNAVLSGRGILEEYAFNDPEYTNVLNVINYSDFHCEPMGGGDLEKHSFSGTEGNFMSLFDIEANEEYDKGQVAKLKGMGFSNDYFTQLETSYGTRFSRWKALGLNVETNNFTGETMFNLCRFVITENGVRYKIVFEPCSGLWLSVEPWKDRMPSGQYPWKSYATHEDDKNFWSKGYCDDFWPIANSVIILFNQELTNREKKNFNARAFDKQMFQDVAKLDAAQYRPDALVPADTMGGTKRIAEGIYAFDTPQLQGTIDLIGWMSSYTGQKTGADDLPPGGKNKTSIMLAYQQKQSKRVGLRSPSWQECYQKLGFTFIEGMREYMPPSFSVQVVGENGFTEEQELKRIEVKRMGMIGISIVSSSEQEAADAMKKDAQVKAIELVSKNPQFTKYEKEAVYRNIGQFDESEIQLMLDTKGELSRKQLAHASQNIQDILLGRKPDIYYGADMSYLNYLDTWLTDHKKHVMGKEQQFIELITVMTPIVDGNMQRLAAKQPQQPPAQEQPQKGGKPVGTISPQAVAQKMGNSQPQPAEAQ